MEAIDILEKRIDTLTRILGPVSDGCVADSIKSSNTTTENIVDSLLSTQTLLNGAIGDRECINKTINRSNELEKYLDPNFLEDQQEVRSKEVYLNAVAPELHGQFDQLDKIKQLESTLGAEYFRNIPVECTDKLKQVNLDNAEFTQQSELIEESLILAMKRYGEIQAGLLESLEVMNKRLDKIEERLQKKKQEDLVKDLPLKE